MTSTERAAVARNRRRVAIRAGMTHHVRADQTVLTVGSEGQAIAVTDPWPTSTDAAAYATRIANWIGGQVVVDELEAVVS